jgi:predicted nuclease of predicted toxin-antitoxin system
MKLLIDMNLSPAWVEALRSKGWDAVHWVTIGEATAPDTEIMLWARTNSFVVFTHDLDFGILLALTHANGPSVIQVRTPNTMPEDLLDTVSQVLERYQNALERGALVGIDLRRARVRILPL